MNASSDSDGGRRRVWRAAIALFAVLVAVADAHAAILVQDFDAVAASPTPPGGPGSFCPQSPAFTAAGWVVVNNSQRAVASRCVSQGYPADSGFAGNLSGQSFNSLAGDSAYAGFGWWAAESTFAPLSLWMVSPPVEIGADAVLEFWTRHVVDPTTSRDRLQVRLSSTAGPLDTGTTPADVGQFDVLLLDINPNLQGDFACPPNGIEVTTPGTTIPGYPRAWCKVRVPVPSFGNGFHRFAFRYVSLGSVPGTVQHFIGVDSVRFDPGQFVPPQLDLSGAPLQFDATGGPLLGDAASFRIPVLVTSPGTGDAVTTLQVVGISAPFQQFATVSVQGATPTPDALTGSCIRGETTVDRVVSFVQTRGSLPPETIATRTLRCGRGVGRNAYNRYADVVRADDPRLYWRLGEASGDAANAAVGPSGIGNLGTGVASGAEPILRLQAPVMPYGTPNDFSVRLSGNAEQRVSSSAFDKLPAGADGITFELWLRDGGADAGTFTNLVGDRQAALGDSFAFLYRAPQNALRMHVMTTNGLMSVSTAPNVVAFATPRHVVATWSAVTGQIRIYIDGSEVPTTVVAGTNPTTGLPANAAANPIYVATDLAETRTHMQGDLDEIAVYSRVLSPERIRVHNDVGRSFGDGFGD